MPARGKATTRVASTYAKYSRSSATHPFGAEYAADHPRHENGRGGSSAPGAGADSARTAVCGRDSYGAGERGGDLLADQAGLAHTRHHYAAAALLDRVKGTVESLIEAADEIAQGPSFDLQHAAGGFKTHTGGKWRNRNQFRHGDDSTGNAADCASKMERPGHLKVSVPPRPDCQENDR